MLTAEKLTLWSKFLGVLVLTLGALYIAYNVIASDGRVDYCYTKSYIYNSTINPDTITYDLYGHVRWGFDRRIVNEARSFEDAISAARLIDCEVK